MTVSRNVSIVLHHVLANYIATNEIFVKCVGNFSGNSGNSRQIQKTIRIIYFVTKI